MSRYSITGYKGLSEAVAADLEKQFGKNIIRIRQMPEGLATLLRIVKEPLFILLIIACFIYFLLHETAEGFIMLIAVILVAGISFFQEMRSNKALKALQSLTEPEIKVIRDGTEKWIKSARLVPGDIMILEEGVRIPADGIVLEHHDFSVNESILTGESFPVEKNLSDNNQLFKGTMISSGYCVAKVVDTGNNTRLGKMGKEIQELSFSKTILQKQLGNFVKVMGLLGAFAFLLILAVNFYETNDFITSILFSLTLAMSIIPEEIPVAFSTFMALGAYRLSQSGIIVKQPQTIENLGAADVICLDKTGTLTENKMKVIAVYDETSKNIFSKDDITKATTLLTYAQLASELVPFDSMEQAILEAYTLLDHQNIFDLFKKIHEYPLSGTPPMMTHVYEKDNGYVVAAKGALERIMRVCKLSSEKQQVILNIAKDMGNNGWRMLGVASASCPQPYFPENQDAFDWHFEGIIAFMDPLQENTETIIQNFYQAGMEVKILTGDFKETAQYIARQINIKNEDTVLTGDEIMQMPEKDVANAIISTNVFARSSPEAKLKIINALKASGKITAMTGDGVNDALALKAAHIGIAMGKKGTPFSRQAADMVITDDKLEKIIIAISHGRRIYENLKKAIRYIISIHIPIILTVCVPLLLNWKVVNIFSPIHIIFLELIMGPTCSVFFENEPVEPQIMQHQPHKQSSHFFNYKELAVSILQGLMITLGVLGLYKWAIMHQVPPDHIRTLVFLTIIISNIFLVFADRSYKVPLWISIAYRNQLIWLMTAISILFFCALLFIAPVRVLFALSVVSGRELILMIIIAAASVLWIEVLKIYAYYSGEISR